MRLLIFGLGYVGQALAARVRAQGWQVAATYRDAPGPAFADLGVQPVSVPEAAGIEAEALLITAAPAADGCPAFAALGADMGKTAAGRLWTGYLSTTGVYGDYQGRWVFEDSPLRPLSPEGMRRQAAEDQWLTAGAAVFRLPGIYGPGRSPFDRLRAGQARSIVREGQVFSRIHVQDLAAGLEASLARPRPGGVYNLCDDEPAPAHVVTAHAAALIGVPAPPLEAYDPAVLAPQARRFYAESKRVSNAQAKAELGWRPAYPTYREGLAAVLRAGG